MRRTIALVAVGMTLGAILVVIVHSFPIGGTVNTHNPAVNTEQATAPVVPVVTPVTHPVQKTENKGFVGDLSTGIATLLALGAFALIAVGGARTATRKRS